MGVFSVKEEIYISLDIEASGPIPGDYSMLSLGACVVGKTKDNFYIELKPLNNNYIKKALEICGLGLENLNKNGIAPIQAMTKFEKWIRKTANYKKPVFVGFNAPFDWMFVDYYFHHFIGRNPFGISGLDIKAYYMGMMNCSWQKTSRKHLDKRFLSNSPHTHNALDDTIEQANIFEKMLKHQEKR